MIEITTSLLMLASAFTPMATKAVADAQVTAGEGEATTTAEQALPAEHPLTSVSVEAYVRDFFKDAPILAEVAKCESEFRQFDKDGNIIRGRVNSADVGVMQINTYYHEDSAKQHGFDIYTIDGNLGFAKWLYAKYGDSPWVHSSKCWKKYKTEGSEIAKI